MIRKIGSDRPQKMGMNNRTTWLAQLEMLLTRNLSNEDPTDGKTKGNPERKPSFGVPKQFYKG